MKALIALAAVTVTSVFFMDYCNLIYRCGCEPIWAGRDAHCNRHAMSGKHCPVCSLPFPGQVMVWAAMAIPQLAVSLWPAPWTRTRRLAFALLTFPVTGLPFFIGLGIWKGYWNI